MYATKTPHKILELMRKHELVISSLYAAYANKFPEYKEFWTALSNEEVEHAELISVIGDIVEKKPEDFIFERFPESAINHSIEYLNEIIERADMPSYQIKNALSEAVYLEQALIENKYFQIFEGDSSQIKNILNTLSQSTLEHYKKVQKAWREQRAN